MKHNSVRPTLKDPKDKRFQFHKHFGIAINFPDEFDADANLTMPDQDADNRPTACTAYTITDIGTDQDQILYSVDYQFMKTLEVQNQPPDADGADGRTAFKVACSFGLLPKDKEPAEISMNSQEWAANQDNWDLALDVEAKKNLKPAYLPIAPVPDYFDGIRSAFILGEKEHRTVGIATQWSPDFEDKDYLKYHSNTLTDNPKNKYWGHMYKVNGWKLIYGQPYLKLKTWQGKGYGDGGIVYMSRTGVNKLLSTWGTYAATIQKLPQNTIDALKQEQNNLLDAAIALCQNLIIRLKYQLGL